MPLPNARPAGGCIFAEDPALDASSARILWRADCDPFVVAARAVSTVGKDPEHILFEALPGCRVLILGASGVQHLSITDGACQVRIDIEGSITDGPVRLHYQLAGITGVDAQLHTLRRFLSLLRLGRFAQGLESVEPRTRVERWIMMLRAFDLAAEGASQRDIAAHLFGHERASADWRSHSDSLRLQVQRLLRDGNGMVNGGHLQLLAGGKR